MVKKIILILTLLVFSCSSHKINANFTSFKSNVADLSFSDISNLKEHKVCESGSRGIGGGTILLVMIAPIFFPLLFVNSSLPQNDPTLSAAAKAGGIKKIKMVDHVYNVDFFTKERCTIIYGE